MRIAGLRLTFASRILAGYLLVFGIASWVFYDALIEEIKPVVRQTAESALIDTANIMAELVAEDVANSDFSGLKEASIRIHQRQLSAIVWEHLRANVILNFYITDAQGTVVYSSEGKDVGADYSQWRDVYLTLAGKYGARSSLASRYDAESSVMHVAAPVLFNDELVGVLTVYNPNQTMQPFVEASRQKVLIKWLLVLFASGLVALILSFWLSRSVARLAQYAKKVQVGGTPQLPKLLGSELNELAQSLEQMRIKLEGKDYVEHYVQTLTHELKSPMAAIRGAAEMLEEDLPADVKSKFLLNINEQNLRMQRTIDQLLRLSSLENQTGINASKSLTATELCESVIAQAQTQVNLKAIRLSLNEVEPFSIQGDFELLSLALGNVVDNALEFSTKGSKIEIKIVDHQIQVTDEGEGVPEYALDKVGTKFFSLPRPNGQPKSTGLGLALAIEIGRMHQATLHVANREGSATGALVTLNFVQLS
jgi:two-component system sensor histidine kinase CreC